ncbi:MAG TPA: (2Fe-2S)-binding protein [Clostridiales bacterium UBA8960]|jgi:carbon-monoxide dehydrogenase small subunit|nr:(2Fe-2S)-binding protein [Clostridiales bacterium UBA8960]
MIRIKGHWPVKCTVNGEMVTLIARPGDTLLRSLREQVGLTGAKSGCENGDCGACTVLVESLPVKSCMMLTVEVDGKSIVTIEGLKGTEIQEAFHENGGFQCGYCTSGFVVNAFALLEEKPFADDEEKKNWLSANLCRCTGYEGIKRSVDAAQKKVQKRDKDA